MNNIHNFLSQNGWKDIGFGEYISQDNMFKIFIDYQDDLKQYLIRCAILPLFDRWANSGSDAIFSDYEEAITYLKGAYILDACSELNAIVEDNMQNDTFDDKTHKLICDIIDLVTEYCGKRRF